MPRYLSLSDLLPPFTEMGSLDCRPVLLKRWPLGVSVLMLNLRRLVVPGCGCGGERGSDSQVGSPTSCDQHFDPVETFNILKVMTYAVKYTSTSRIYSNIAQSGKPVN